MFNWICPRPLAYHWSLPRPRQNIYATNTNTRSGPAHTSQKLFQSDDEVLLESVFKRHPVRHVFIPTCEDSRWNHRGPQTPAWMWYDFINKSNIFAPSLCSLRSRRLAFKWQNKRNENVNTIKQWSRIRSFWGESDSSLLLNRNQRRCRERERERGRERGTPPTKLFRLGRLCSLHK